MLFAKLKQLFKLSFYLAQIFYVVFINLNKQTNKTSVCLAVLKMGKRIVFLDFTFILSTPLIILMVFLQLVPIVSENIQLNHDLYSCLYF